MFMLYARRRHGYTLAANLGYGLHIAPDLFQSLGSPAGVLYNPFRKRNRTFHSQTAIRDSLPQVRQSGRAASILMDRSDPGFNGMVTGLRRHIDLVRQIQAIAADGRG